MLHDACQHGQGYLFAVDVRGQSGDVEFGGGHGRRLSDGHHRGNRAAHRGLHLEFFFQRERTRHSIVARGARAGMRTSSQAAPCEGRRLESDRFTGGTAVSQHSLVILDRRGERAFVAEEQSEGANRREVLSDHRQADGEWSGEQQPHRPHTQAQNTAAVSRAIGDTPV